MGGPGRKNIRNPTPAPKIFKDSKDIKSNPIPHYTFTTSTNIGLPTQIESNSKYGTNHFPPGARNHLQFGSHELFHRRRTT